jgi:hypothetical protein
MAGGAVGTACAASAGPDPLPAQIAAIAAELDSRVPEAIAGIDGTGPQLLALRSYLRSSRNLAERWSWTQEQIAAFAGSPEQFALQKEVESVRAAFAEANPGYELWVNPQIRSLDVQVAHWNRNESVAAAAAGLLAAVLDLVSSPQFPGNRPDAAHEALKRFLIAYSPEVTPTVAAPGLSPHGQMRAIDFQVHRDGKVVAGPVTASIATDWEAAGWAGKLDAAVRASGQHFVGPLANPKEPWHYTYAPEAVAAK